MNALNALLSLETVYALAGLLLGIFAVITWRDRGNPKRITSGLFWCLFGVIFAFGGVLPHAITGLLVLAMAAIDGAGRVGAGKAAPVSREEQQRHADRLGHRTFAPVLAIPVAAIVFALGFRAAGLDANRGVLIGLGFGSVAAMVVGLRITGGTVREMLHEGHRLNDAMGSVNILPQLLASLGVVFTAAKVGDLIAKGIQSVVSGDNLFLLALANCAGMTLFTFVMGNSFAAFSVIAAGVTVPLLVRPLGVDPAMAGILTLTAGSTGTLITVMAANFNVVPVALLNMRDYYGVIRFQLPYAAAMWVCHVALLWVWIR